jgi:hypothetical protein
VVLGFYEEEQKVLVFKLFLEWIQFQFQNINKWNIGSGSTLVLEEKKIHVLILVLIPEIRTKTETNHSNQPKKM